MSPKPDVPNEISEALVQFHRWLCLERGATPQAKKEAYALIATNYGKNAADIAWALYESNITVPQVQYYFGDPTVSNVTQTAGGHMTGVNATGTQTIRDITIYSQDLEATGTSINSETKAALCEARKAIQDAEIDSSIKPVLVEQFDKLTEELKKGDQKNSGFVGTMWSMLYAGVKAAPAALTALASLDKLKLLLGF